MRVTARICKNSSLACSFRTEAHLIDKPEASLSDRRNRCRAKTGILLLASARVVLSDTGARSPSRFCAAALNRRFPRHVLYGKMSRFRFTMPDCGKQKKNESFTMATVASMLMAMNTSSLWNRVRPCPRHGSTCWQIRSSALSFPEDGSAYTWKENAYGFRLTPWMNDPVTDASGEAFYLRDEHTATHGHRLHCPCAVKHYTIRHGFGYSVFMHNEHGIVTELTVFCGQRHSCQVCIAQCHQHNDADALTFRDSYVEWVLGDVRSKTAMHIITGREPATGCLYARTSVHHGLPGRVAFFDADATNRTATCDRAEFIGRNGSLSNPAGMKRVRLSAGPSRA